MAARKVTPSTEAPSGAAKFPLILKESSEAHECEFTASAGLYQVAPGASADSVYNQLSLRMEQLVAMMMVVSGGADESFNAQAEEIRAAYLWAVTMMAKEAQQLLGLLSPVFPMQERH